MVEMKSRVTRTAISVRVVMKLSTTSRWALPDGSMTLGMAENSSRMMAASEISTASSEPRRPIVMPTRAEVTAGALFPPPSTIV